MVPGVSGVILKKEKVLETVIMIAQHCEQNSCHQIVHLRMIYMAIFVMYINKKTEVQILTKKWQI